MILNDKTYNVLKWVALCVLPGLATLCLAIAGIWKLPYGEEIAGTITAFDAFLGAVLGISSAQYNKSK